MNFLVQKTFSPSVALSIIFSSAVTLVLAFHFGTFPSGLAISSENFHSEFHRPLNHRSAMNTLKELDKLYSQLARPRFGKRQESATTLVDDNTILDHGPWRWLLINRDQPLTKLTENYLHKILAENEEIKQSQQDSRR